MPPHVQAYMDAGHLPCLADRHKIFLGTENDYSRQWMYT